MSVEFFPAVNAVLNGLSAILLLVAYICIKQRRIYAHACLMISALVTSALFLVGYLVYHAIAGEKSTATMTWLPGWLRAVYLAILFPHLLLAIAMLPMIFMTLWRAYKRDWARHRKIAKPTFFIWMYVSVTGVVIYWMLYHLFPTMKSS